MDTKEAQIKQHSALETLAYHLLPGVAIVIFYALIVRPVRNAGFPSLFAIFLTILFVLIPTLLGILFYESKKAGLSSILDLMPYQKSVPKLQFIGLVVALFLWSSLSIVISAAVDPVLIKNLFGWVPTWFLLNEDLTVYSKSALAITIFSGIVLNGFVGPIVEELYFRGFLLPRISRFGWLAPVINIVLFSVYHFFTPWQNVGRIIGLMPWAFVAKWKENIYIPMVAHVLGNTIGMLGLLSLLQ